MRRHIHFRGLFVLLILSASNVIFCENPDLISESQIKQTREENNMNSLTELDRLLSEGNWDSVKLAQQLGDEAWPTIRSGAKMPDYRSRQIAMVCAGRIGGNTGGIILAEGLSDVNVNVRATAAAQLSVNPPATSKAAVIETLYRSSESDIREMLALAAGYLPGQSTMEVLSSLADGKDVLGTNARMALAKLGDPGAREQLISNLTSEDPYRRYEALGQLRYVNDPEFAKYAKGLLWDKADAILIGPERNQRFRRVCDQAVDTLVYLMKLSLPFETSVETIYTDDELLQVDQIIR
jgi:hypothetical protein